MKLFDSGNPARKNAISQKMSLQAIKPFLRRKFIYFSPCLQACQKKPPSCNVTIEQ